MEGAEGVLCEGGLPQQVDCQGAVCLCLCVFVYICVCCRVS